jgi:hypothetical protein
MVPLSKNKQLSRGAILRRQNTTRMLTCPNCTSGKIIMYGHTLYGAYCGMIVRLPLIIGNLIARRLVATNIDQEKHILIGLKATLLGSERE